MEQAAGLVAAIRDQLLLGDSPPTNVNYDTATHGPSAPADDGRRIIDDVAAAIAKSADTNATMTSAETTKGADPACSVRAAHTAPPISAHHHPPMHQLGSPSRMKMNALLIGRNSPARRGGSRHEVQRRLVQGRRAYSRQRHDVLPQSHRELYKTLLLSAEAERRKRLEMEQRKEQLQQRRERESEQQQLPPNEVEEQSRRASASRAARFAMVRAQSNRSLASSGAGTATATIPELDDDEYDDEDEGKSGGGEEEAAEGADADDEGEDDSSMEGEDDEGEAISDYEDAVQTHRPSDDPSDDEDDRDVGDDEDDALPATPRRSTPRDRNNQGHNADDKNNDGEGDNDGSDRHPNNNDKLPQPFKMSGAGNDDKLFPIPPGERELPNDASLTSVNSSLCTSNLSTGSNHSADGAGNHNRGGGRVDDNVSPPPTVGVGFMLLNSSSGDGGGTVTKVDEGGGGGGGGMDGRRLFPTTTTAATDTSSISTSAHAGSESDPTSSSHPVEGTVRGGRAEPAAPPSNSVGPSLDPPPRPQRTTGGAPTVPFPLPPAVPPSSGGGAGKDEEDTSAASKSVATMGHSSLLLLCSHALRGGGGDEDDGDGFVSPQGVGGGSLPRALSATELNQTLQGSGDEEGESSSAAIQNQLVSSPQRQRQRRGSSGSISKNAAPGSNPNTPTRGRIQMFGSEYARFLSSTPFSPAIPRKKQSLMSSLARRSREANYLQHTSSGGGGGAFSRHHHHHGGGGGPSSRAPPTRVQNLEDKSDAALTGAVMDLVVTHGNEIPPRGYCRISQTSHGGNADLTSNMGGVGVYLNVKKESSWDRAVQRPCVVSLAVIFPDRNEFVPPGFCVVRRYKQKSSSKSSSKESSSSSSNNKTGGGGGDAMSPGGASPTSPPTGRSGNNPSGGGAIRSSSGNHSDTVPANLNFGTSGERVYLCYKRSRDGNPITGVLPLQPTRKEPIPEGYTVLERTPRNYVADVNSGAGPPMFVAFRQRLANLEMLRPLPLLLAQYTLASQKSSSSSGSTSGGGRRRRLLAYYCTGGTIVPSNAGKYHIMDRTAHPRVSPSSVATRISLVHSSPSADYKPSYNNWNLSHPVVKKENSSSSLPSSTTSSGLAAVTTRRDNRLTESLRTDGDSSSVMTDNYLQTTSSDLTMSDSVHQSSFEQFDDSDLSTYCGSVTSSSVRGGGGNRHHHPRNMSYSSSSTAGGASVQSGPTWAAGGGQIQPSFHSSSSHHHQQQQQPHDTTIPDNSNEASADYDPLREIQDASQEAMEFIPTIVDGSGSGLTNTPHAHPSRLESRIAVLNPVLTACYTQHGGSALVAVEGLSKLLSETDFFMDDKRKTSSKKSSEEDGEEVVEMGENLTLLDLAVQVVCDVATSSARETHFGPCVEFASNALRYAGGVLHNRTLGYILRLNLFVCYFGASVPTSSSWPETLQSSSCILSEFGGGGGGGGGGGRSSGNKVAGASTGVEDGKGSNTLRSSWTPSRIKSDPPLLLDRKSTTTSRLAIGAPHASALAMRDMLTLLLSRLESAAASSSSSNGAVASHQQDGRETVSDFIGAIVSDLVDSSVHRVHVANFTQLALHQIQRGGGSELFWYDMTATCGRGLFGDDRGSEAHIVAFSLLASLTKVASGKIRRVQDTASFVPRDVASKLLSLELLLHYVKILASSQESVGGDTVSSTSDESSLALVYSIRRLVVPSLMSNAANGFDDSRVFRRILYIITALWANLYRRHLKVEIAVLFDQYMLRVLQMGPQVLRCRRNRLDQQLDVLTEVVRWFASPHDVLELFLNYDADDKSNWNVFQQMCSALCTLAEQCGEIVLEQFTAQKSRVAIGGGGDGGSGVGGAGTEVYRMKEAARTLQEQALHAICHVVRSLKDASWHIYMMSSEEAHNSQSSSNDSSGDLKSNDSPAKGNLFATLSKDKSYPSFLSTPPRLSNSNAAAAVTEPRPVIAKAKTSASVEASLGRGKTQSAIKPPRPGSNKTTEARTRTNQPQRPSSLLTRSSSGDIITERNKAEKTLDIAFEIVHEKGLKKALDYLIACNVLTPSARDVASFLRMHRDRLDPKTVGNFLGEGHRSDGEYWNLIRYHYVRATSFVDMNVEQGLRHFLTSSGFRLPGEAQQIDRVITTFAQCFWEDNAGDHSICPFRNQETVFLLSFAIIMLNTDLHRASADTSTTPSRKRKKMTRQEFLSNLKGAVHSDDLSKDYVFALYDSIEAQPIKINHSLTIQNGAHILFGHSSSGGAHTKQNASSSNNDASPSMSYVHSTKSLTSGVKAAQEVLRGFALYEEPFLKFGNDATLSRSLVRKAVSSTWFHFHSIINAMLDSPQPDRQKLLPGLDILQSALGATILLELKMERSAFIRQLARIKFIFDRGVMYEALHHDAKTYVIREKYKEEAWYKELEESLDSPESTTSGSVRGIERVHALVREMRGSLQVDTRTISELHRVAHRIRNGAFLLKDNRSFIREGDLIKRCRNKRHITYRFFLFSDRLIYAHLSSTHDDFKIHEDLPLSAMKILDVDARKHHAFVIVHPTKSFTVIAPTAALKSSWIADIKDAVDKAIERYAKLRKSMIKKS